MGEGGAELGDAQAGDIVITEHVPDWLPQASALITSDPQTPLAHVNLLARNRGIPNASQAGIHDDAGLRQAARVRAHAIVLTGGSSLQIALDHPRAVRHVGRAATASTGVGAAGRHHQHAADGQPRRVGRAAVAGWFDRSGGRRVATGHRRQVGGLPDAAVDAFVGQRPDAAARSTGHHGAALHRAPRPDPRHRCGRRG